MNTQKLPIFHQPQDDSVEGLSPSQNVKISKNEKQTLQGEMALAVARRGIHYPVSCIAQNQLGKGFYSGKFSQPYSGNHSNFSYRAFFSY